MNWVAAVVLLALVECYVFAMLVGRARGRYGILAPAVSGNEAFERYFRVHQNSIEQLVLFIPAVWLFGIYVGPRSAAIIGAVYLLARLIYAVGYIADPKKRGPGAGLTFVSVAILTLGALWGVLRSLISS
jgi:glutathione S-transferase